MKILKIAAITFAAVFMESCKTPTVIDNVYATTNFKVECMGTDLDGSQTLRSWGTGKNKSQAMEAARKNAVRAVIFDGVNAGSGDCSKRPLVTEVNAAEKYESYFNRFFTDGGEFRQFTSLTDEKRNSRVKSSNKSIENWGVVVRVDRAALKERLIADGIIKP